MHVSLSERGFLESGLRGALGVGKLLNRQDPGFFLAKDRVDHTAAVYSSILLGQTNRLSGHDNRAADFRCACHNMRTPTSAPRFAPTGSSLAVFFCDSGGTQPCFVTDVSSDLTSTNGPFLAPPRVALLPVVSAKISGYAFPMTAAITCSVRQRAIARGIFGVPLMDH
jgi:hypothetical protein